MLRSGLRLLVPCLVLLILSAAMTRDASACSGGGQRAQLLSETLSAADVIVRGTVVWVDDTHRNLILRVKHYLNGRSGPREILVQMLKPIMVEYDRRVPSAPRCGFRYPVLPLAYGDDLVMFLDRVSDGSYIPASHIFWDNSYGRFTGPESTIKVGYLTGDSAEDNVIEDINRRQLVDLIQSRPDMFTVVPQDAPAPFHAPLLVTTDSGRHYLMPIDGEATVELTTLEYMNLRRFNLACWLPDCTAWSPKTDNQVKIYGSKWLEAEPHINGSYRQLQNQAVVFSPTGDAYAVWVKTGDGMMIDIVVSNNSVTTWSYAANFPHPPDQMSVELTYDEEFPSLIGAGAWSPDGRFLAFIDSRGLWMWDVFVPDAQPVLTEFQNISGVQGFSQTGRYLYVTQNGEKHHIDLVTGELWPDGAWSPDDRVLITLKEPKLIRTVPHSEMTYLNRDLITVQWIGRWEFVRLSCENESRLSCSIMHDTLNQFYDYPILYVGYAFAHSRDTGSLIVVQDGQTLLFRDGPIGEHREISLQGQLDSDIASVEWLPSLFYDSSYDERVP